MRWRRRVAWSTGRALSVCWFRSCIGGCGACSSWLYFACARSGRRNSRFSYYASSCWWCGISSLGRGRGRPGTTGCAQPLAAAVGLVVAVCLAGDAFALASSAGRAALDVCAAQDRAPQGGRRRLRACLAAGAGESDLGLPAHPGRAGWSRDPACAQHGLGDPAAPRDRAGAAAGGAELVAVPARASVNDRRLRFPDPSTPCGCVACTCCSSSSSAADACTSAA
jgi:hypothetical protein